MLRRDPMAHKNERCRGERQLARVRFSINIRGRPAGHSYDIAIFDAATLVRGLLACTISLAGAHVQFRLMRHFCGDGTRAGVCFGIDRILAERCHTCSSAAMRP
jgi:hypothetical protein